ncbi:hypothetical protein [Vreelandella sulfidaeris]|uniref:hypothetical protein n=1 Tax=Vreelandella sulfidaeris TaxID=115553 RepID=UPI00142D6C36|nr:hypothetical protein [Halomonas sulfidaeris]
MTDRTVSSLRRRRGHPQGLDLSPVALVALRALLGDERQQPSLRQRDQLPEHLHSAGV